MIIATRIGSRSSRRPAHRITRATLLVLLLVLPACKGGASSSPAPGAGPASGSAQRPAVAVDAGADGVPGAVVVADAGPTAVVDAAPSDATSACRPTCLYASDLPLADAITRHAAECKADWYAADDCDGLLYARNCIYAAYGNVFKTAAWKDRFTHEPWYRPNPAFTDRDLPAVATANIKALKAQYEACTKPVPAVTLEDQHLAAATYERVIVREEDVEGISPDDLAAARDSHRNLYVNDRTTYAYEAAPSAGRRTIVLSGLFYAVGGGELRPDEGATLTFEGDKLVEIR